MPAPAWFMTCAMLMAVIAVTLPGPDLLPDWAFFPGIALVLGGALLNHTAMSAFARSGTPMDPEREPSALVEDGPYRFTRNPMYLAGILILGGLVLVFAEVRCALVLPLYVLLATLRFVPSDERRMEARFGDAWRDYRRRVRRWI